MIDGANTISVAMCTLDGAAFVEDQLRSIVGQSRPPDELVVCDDGSADGTVELVEAFARTAAFPVRIVVNEERLGPAKNFERAIASCNGGSIALADQDDVWHADKLLMQERRMNTLGLDAVFSDADVVGADLRPLGYRLWTALEFTRRDRRLIGSNGAVRVLLRKDVVTGATLLFRSDLRDTILPIPEGWIHDAWIALVIGATGRLGFVDEPLIKYRQHAANAIGAVEPRGAAARLAAAVAPRAREDAAVFRSQRERYETGYARLRELCADAIDPAVLAEMHAKSAHVRRRSAIPARRLRRIPVVAGELASGRYHRYSGGWRSAGKDLLIGT